MQQYTTPLTDSDDQEILEEEIFDHEEKKKFSGNYIGTPVQHGDFSPAVLEDFVIPDPYDLKNEMSFGFRLGRHFKKFIKAIDHNHRILSLQESINELTPDVQMWQFRSRLWQNYYIALQKGTYIDIRAAMSGIAHDHWLSSVKQDSLKLSYLMHPLSQKARIDVLSDLLIEKMMLATDRDPKEKSKEYTDRLAKMFDYAQKAKDKMEDDEEEATSLIPRESFESESEPVVDMENRFD